mmetsp:Transcript_9335/g.12893  ORF Transcript_9335/g.12893 Transcript_9335/m.12893 type:complete len:81 (+) Transcript_9335:198-440(+)
MSTRSLVLKKSYLEYGHILESESLDIKVEIDLSVFELPSNSHQTIICVCLSTAEKIFLIKPATVYAIRIILYDLLGFNTY